MFVSLGIEVPLGQAEIDDVHDLGLLAPAHHEVVGFNIAMHETVPVNHFESCYDLNSDIESSGYGKTLLA